MTSPVHGKDSAPEQLALPTSKCGVIHCDNMATMTYKRFPDGVTRAVPGDGWCEPCFRYFAALPSDAALAKGAKWPAEPAHWGQREGA